MPKKPKPPVKQSPELKAYLDACAKVEAEKMEVKREFARTMWKVIKKGLPPQRMIKVPLILDDEGED